MAEQLTDSELRRQLAAYGQKNIGPITATTRPIYIKKLNHLRSAERRSSRGSTKPVPSRKLIGFSSDESEGEDSQGSSRGRRQSRGRGKGRVKAPTPTVSTRPSLRQRRSGLMDEPSTASVSAQASIHSINSTLDTSSSFARDRHFDDPDGFNSSDTDTEFNDDSTSYYNSHNSPELVTRSVNTSPRMDDSALFNRTFSKYNSPSDTYTSRGLRDRPTTNVTPSRSNTHPTNITPDRNSSSSWRNTLGWGKSQKTVTPTSGAPQSNNNQQHVNHIGNHITGNSLHPPEKDKVLPGFKTEEDPGTYQHSQYISLVLLLLVGLFFAVVGLVYLNVTGSSETSLSKDTWLICPPDDQLPGDGSSEECFPYDSVTAARELVLTMFEALSKRAGDFECGTSQQRNMSLREIQMLFTEKYRHEFGMASTNNYSLHVALQLILSNPHWKIKLMDSAGAFATAPAEVTHLEAEVPYLTLWCRTYRASIKVVYGLMLVVTVTCAVALVIAALRYRWRKQEEETKQVYSLVEKIIDILKSHHDACQTDKSLDPFLAIPHVRDMLIPLKDRRNMQPVWDKAVKSLSANESRVRVETQKIAGEEFAVWRWLQTCTNANGNRVWQGQAFGEHKDLGMNCPPYSLTQCLKIRNMFDPDIECEDDWPIRIQDAILEKCAQFNHGIVHIAVDKTSREGCVYVKCVSAEAAGRCYKALHGWWFDGNLVTVKYLRLERYHERFPDAVHAESYPLKPSNNQKLSLSQPFYRSLMETA